MAFEPIRSILPQAIRSAGLNEQVTAARVVEVTAQTLIRLWGEERAALIEIISFREGTVKIRSRSGVAIQTLKTEESSFINAVNRVLGARVVRRLSW